MPYHTGPDYGEGVVRIGAPRVTEILATSIDADVLGAVGAYLGTARRAANEYYFSIYENETPVGQIVLHSMNLTTSESLVGYCLFRPELRGRGIGTQALRLLQQFVVEKMQLARLVIITSNDNLASQSVARKCGFEFTGGAWEDPEQLLVFQWIIPRQASN
jgi:RimJ/RimL family protein N-acetyltransferase